MLSPYLGLRFPQEQLRSHIRPGASLPGGPGEEKTFLVEELYKFLSSDLVSGNVKRIIVIFSVLATVTRKRGGGGGADAIPRKRFRLRRNQRKMYLQKQLRNLYLCLIRGNIIWIVVIIVHSEGAGSGDGDWLRGQGGGPGLPILICRGGGRDHSWLGGQSGVHRLTIAVLGGGGRGGDRELGLTITVRGGG